MTDPAHVWAMLEQGLEQWEARAEWLRYRDALRRRPAPTPRQLIEAAARNAAYEARRRAAARERRLREEDGRRLWDRRRREAAARRDRLELAGVSSRWARRFSWWGFGSPDDVRYASDDTLLAFPNVGRRTLQAIRAEYPHAPRPLPAWLAEE